MKDTLPLWTPSDEFRRSTPMFAFMQEANGRFSQKMEGFSDLHAWSIENRADFWTAVWDFCGIKGDRGQRALINADQMLEASFFPDASVNFAENLLATTGNGDAIVFRGEDKVSYRWSWDQLHAMVSKLQQAFKALGVVQGDRIAAMMPNLPETVACMLAASSIGAIWSSCSPDFGEQGVLDRFGQIEPKLFIACSGYWYNGKLQNISAKVGAISARLKAPTIIVPYACGVTSVLEATPGALLLEDVAQSYEAKPVEFTRLSFSHPLFILFSSGTTGVPKCIVHSAGGSLLQLIKEHRLHCGIVPGDKVFYFTTCGWMMWNWLVVGLAAGATLCLYDGSPFAPDGNVLFAYAQAERFAVFGTSAKYIDAVRKSGLTPISSHDLSDLRLITSTGSPLSPEGFSFVYEGIKNDVQLASISGGTDIVSCFVLGNPLSPVWRGEIQGPGLGLAMDVWNDQGDPVREEKGELVCAKAFPSMPVMFWNDPDQSKYRAAYFERFDNVWCHGDFAEWTEHDGLIIHGRSDATLNPGGVRIGTAEIYNQVEQLPEVEEALCIGQDWDDDVRVVLFVRLAPGVDLDESLSKAIRDKIRIGASPRHVPAKIVAVPEIPRTKSGKIVELAVREIVHGRPVKNMEALANPEALAHFGNRSELRT
ncbi:MULTISPECIES: acetoacetate--CoA ligase [Agrobacterium]|uniref:Acetoacetate--CoA ligase n=2 Tax=Agrobacterium TaxID=357 RepID=A0A4D7Z114_AGRTU|nr:acetoacetate--CoA ligase [Agrobacterium tumefaciens]KJF71674.1 acetoacetyl-CoA synthetase [Agrobacterium arsenijevicii]QCL96804.1 acetoacetate--CoA ligase [Agrobacterium tumefaciens]